MKLIPAIDIIDGRLVRLSQGDFERRVNYDMSVFDAAQFLENSGFKYLHIVDLDAAREGKLVNIDLIQNLISTSGLVVDYGGGIRNLGQLELLFKAGVSKVNIGSAALKDIGFIAKAIKDYGSDRVVWSADVNNGFLMSNAWQDGTDMNLMDIMPQYLDVGVTEMVCTDISRDGMLKGPNLDLYRNIIETYNVLLVASGGISGHSDLLDLRKIECHAAIIGKAIYEGKLNIDKAINLC